MKLGIIVAMEEELKVVIDEMKIEEKSVTAGMTFCKGTYHDIDIIAVVCGVGKVNSAVCTQILISEYKADKIINIGVAGGIEKGIKPGDVVIADSLVQHDVDATGFDYELGQIPRLDTFDFKSDKELIEICKKASDGIEAHEVFVGRIATGDQFIACPDKIKWIKDTFDAIACEMEGGSIAQVCYLNRTPFVVIRSISDNADGEAQVSFDEFLMIAVENASVILSNMLKTMSN